MRLTNPETWVYLLSAPGMVIALIGLVVGSRNMFANGVALSGFVIFSFFAYVLIGAVVVMLREKWKR